tara:strand:- start:1072 stop:1446 length:375 start_codon:yes stop_codon:yes gene_type:complete
MNNFVSIKTFDLLARIGLASVFVIAIPVKITKFSTVLSSIVARGIPAPLASFLLVMAIICLSAGSYFLVFGKKETLGASLLLLFLVPTTIIFHLYPFQSTAVFMNIGLIGGLVLTITRSGNYNS